VCNEQILTLNVIDAMSYQKWQYQTSRGISATLALGPGRALILADLPDSFDLSKLTPIVLPDSLYIPSP
jgi:hypothetical protein